MPISNPFTAWLYWDPPRVAFTIPVMDRPVAWYGILFVIGFILGYFIFVPVMTRFLRETKSFANVDNSKVKEASYRLADRLCWFVVLGTLIGARLGSVIFYDWDLYKNNPLEIFQVWKGGLASHGGVIGIFLGIYLYSIYIRRKVPEITLLRLMDFVSIPAGLGACFIRLGNFMNQEILGLPTTLPWGVVFGHAADGSAPIPRHPIQLYEAAAYLITFVVLYSLWKKKGNTLREGTFFGLLMIFIFGSRFILEFWKDAIDSTWDISVIQMGQLLSIPFVLVGLYFLLRQDPKNSGQRT